jgi:hypothetical protein
MGFVVDKMTLEQFFSQYLVFPVNQSTKVKVKVILRRQSVGQSVLVSGTHLGPATNFFHSLFDFFFSSFGFVDVGRPL